MSAAGRKKKAAMVFTLLAAALLFTAPAQVSAGYGLDNPLQPLEGYNPKKSNLAASLEFIPVPTSLGFYEFDKDSAPSKTFTFNFSLPSNTKASYLYLLTKFYDSESEAWLVKLNDEIVVYAEHSPSAGVNPKGDGRDNAGDFAEEVGEPELKQVIRLDATGKLKNGENKISITGIGWEMISSKNAKRYSLYGLAVLNLYQSNKTHEVWAYNGIEYFKRRLVTDEVYYNITFGGASYSTPAKANLYVLYHNGNLTQSKLYFNNNLLGGEKVSSYAGTDFISLMKFDAGSYLSKKDSVTFSTDIGDPYAIYPSLVILDVEMEDKTPPAISMTSPANGSSFLTNQTMDVKYTLDEEVSETYVKIGTRTELPSKVSGVWQAKINLSSSGIGNGTKEITVVAKDLAGNEAKKTLTVSITPFEEQAKKATELDISIGSMSIGEGLEVKEGTDIHVSVDAVNNGGDNAQIESSIYVDNALAESQNATVDALGHRRIDFVVKGVNLQKGTREIKAKIRHIGNATDPNSSDNEKSISVIVKEEQLAPVEKPELKDIDIGISSISIAEGYEVKEGKDIHVSAIGVNKGGDNADVEISIYVDNVLAESQKTTLDAYGHRKVDFVVKGIRLEKGIRELKAEIKHIGEGVRDPERKDNEKSTTVIIEEEKTTLSTAISVGKWAAGILIGVVILKLIIDFISERTREDYLK